jgi:hypothetical protein
VSKSVNFQEGSHELHSQGKTFIGALPAGSQMLRMLGGAIGTPLVGPLGPPLAGPLGPPLAGPLGPPLTVGPTLDAPAVDTVAPLAVGPTLAVGPPLGPLKVQSPGPTLDAPAVDAVAPRTFSYSVSNRT